MRKVDDGEEKEKRKKKKEKREKNGVFSGHYVIAGSLPPERRPLEGRTLVPISQVYYLRWILGISKIYLRHISGVSQVY